MSRLDKDPPEPESPFANTGEVGPEDRTLLESSTGRSPPSPEDADTARDDEIREKSGGGRPASDETNFHLSGTGAIETEDGLDESLEATRQAAEDVSEDDLEEDGDRPIFDKADHA